MNKIEIGRAGTSRIEFDVDTLLLTRALITANSGGGKSYLTRVLLELLRPKVQEIVLDPEDEFSSLREKFDFAQVGEGGEAQMDVRSAALLAERLMEHRISAVCNLYELKEHQRPVWVKNFIGSMMNLPKKLWHPVVVVLDEAQLFAPENGKSESYGAVVDLATRGRKRGFCLIPAVQRLADLSKKVTAQLLNRLVGQTFEDVDVERAIAVLSVPKCDQAAFREEVKNLEPGTFYALGRAISKSRILFKVRAAQTSHPEPGKISRVSVPELPAERLRSLLPKLADLPKAAEEKAKTESELRAEIRALKLELSAKPKAAAPAQATQVATREIIKNRVVEVQVLGKRPVNAIRKAGDQAFKICALLNDMTTKLVETRAGFEGGAQKISEALERFLKPPQKQNLPPSALPPRAQAEPTHPRFVKAPIGPAPRKVSAPTNGEHAEGLSKCHRAILTVLAQYPEGCPIGKISLLAGYKKSGTFMSTLSNLRTSGFMVGENSSIMKVTQEGLEALGEFDPLPVGRDLANYWINHPSFDKCERNILEKLVENPDGLTIGEISEATGYSQSGTFMSSLSTLRTSGVMVGKNSEKMRVSENLL